MSEMGKGKKRIDKLINRKKEIEESRWDTEREGRRKIEKDERVERYR